jgi:hypothetical protein
MEELLNNPKKPKRPMASGEKAGATVVQRWITICKREVIHRLLRDESLDVDPREIGVEFAG